MRIVKHATVSYNCRYMKESIVCPLQYTCGSFNMLADIQKHIAVCFRIAANTPHG